MGAVTRAMQEDADEIKRLRDLLRDALPYLVNRSPGGCDGSHYSKCAHCAAIRNIRDALKNVGTRWVR